MRSSVIFLALVMGTAEVAAYRGEVIVGPPSSVVQAKNLGANSVGAPMPAGGLTVGTWKYATTVVQADGTAEGTHVMTIKDDGSVWTVTIALETSAGPVTDVTTLEKGTLILRKESFKHFAKPGRPWSITTDLDFTGDRVTGTTNSSGHETAIAVDLGGPVFAYTDTPAVIGCLPLADGYATRFRNFDVQTQTVRLLQLKVVDQERVIVPAGAFDSYRVEVTSAEGGPYKQTVWIAQTSRTPVQVSEVLGNRGGTSFTTVLIP